VRNKISLALLFFLVFVLTSILSPVDLSDDDDKRVDHTHFLPDYYIEGLTLIEFSDQGKPATYIHAKNVAGSHETPHVMSLENPEVIWHQDENTQWKIRSDKAHYDSKQRYSELSGQVHIKNEKSQSKQRLDVKTEKLEIDLEKQSVIGKGDVLVKYGPHTMTAGAINANLESGHIQLTEKVKGAYSVDRHSLKIPTP